MQIDTKGFIVAKVGRPLKYETKEELETAIDKYFDEEVGTYPLTDSEGNVYKDKNGDAIYEVKPPTVSGLALYLGFSDRHSMYDYKGREEFSHTIKKAILTIEKFAEIQLLNGRATTGAIFWLKNHGWKDKQETTNTNINYKKKDLSRLTDAELKTMKKIEKKITEPDAK